MFLTEIKRNKLIIKKALERDNFTCQKCKLKDETARSLEVHHMTPLVFEGEDMLENLITLCSDCHKFAPNKKEEFEEYIQEECEGSLTTLVKAFKIVNSQ
jgi:5-methylcytosine-specific restriction endonuclease McrA